MLFKKIGTLLMISLTLTGKAIAGGEDEPKGDSRILTKLSKPIMAKIAGYLPPEDRKNLFLVLKEVHKTQSDIDETNIELLVGACTKHNKWSKEMIICTTNSTFIRKKPQNDFQKSLRKKIDQEVFGFVPEGTVLAGFIPKDLHVTDLGELCEESVIKKIWTKVFCKQSYNEELALTPIYQPACLFSRP